MARSILLRGFDRECVDRIEHDMDKRGVRFIKGCVPIRMEEAAEKRVEVTWEQDGVERSEVFDTVLVATGRSADTRSLGLEDVGVKVEGGKVVCEHEQTSVPNIYAVGDVVYNAPELTPVAIQAGKLLARRLYGGKSEAMDYEMVPTTVFTPMEYGCVGLSEEAARERFGDRVDAYLSAFQPLEWKIVEELEGQRALAKVIVDRGDDERVLGIHYVGPGAGDIIQGFATAMRLGCTFRDLWDTVGIHPVTAEEFTVLEVTRSSGAKIEKGGC